jgi:hypothetical protein
MAISPLLDLTCLKYTFALMGLSAEEVSGVLRLLTFVFFLSMGELSLTPFRENSTRTPPQIRRKLNLPELTPEELAKAREEHPWLFEAEEEAEG